jgi:hypothetical protein
MHDLCMVERRVFSLRFARYGGVIGVSNTGFLYGGSYCFSMRWELFVPPGLISLVLAVNGLASQTDESQGW